MTTSPSLHEDRFLEALDRAFVAAVVRAGGMPFVLPVLDPADVADVASCLDGILFTGGGDIEPARYDALASSHLGSLDPDRDASELALVRAGQAVGLPMLGICRGCQVLNVAMGGTLVQHLPDVTELQHCQRERWAEEVHSIKVSPESELRTVVGRGRVAVNTLHHQAVDEVGLGLRAVAWADDGVIEAVEGVGGNRILGVQWHPELLPAQPGHSELFQWLVEEANRLRALPDLRRRPADALPPLAEAVG